MAKYPPPVIFFFNHLISISVQRIVNYISSVVTIFLAILKIIQLEEVDQHEKKRELHMLIKK